MIRTRSTHAPSCRLRLRLRSAVAGLALLIGVAAAAEVPADPCAVRAERSVESEVLTVRPRSPCTASVAALAAALDAGMAARAPGLPLRSVFIGVLTAYPEISASLARAAQAERAWDSRRGRAREGSDNALVQRLLASGREVQELAHVLARHGYRLESLSVEKVRSAPPDRIPDLNDPSLSGRLPFDAMTWLVVRPQRSSP